MASGPEPGQEHCIKCRGKVAPLLISCRSSKSPKQKLHNNVINNMAVMCSQGSRADLRRNRQWENGSSSESLTGLPTDPVNHSSYGRLPQQGCEPHREQVIQQVPSILLFVLFEENLLNSTLWKLLQFYNIYSGVLQVKCLSPS